MCEASLSAPWHCRLGLMWPPSPCGGAQTGLTAYKARVFSRPRRGFRLQFQQRRLWDGTRSCGLDPWHFNYAVSSDSSVVWEWASHPANLCGSTRLRLTRWLAMGPTRLQSRRSGSGGLTRVPQPRHLSAASRVST